MKIQLIAICTLSIFCIELASASGEYCYKDVIDACGVRGSNLPNCNAKYGAFIGDELLQNVQHYARAHIQRSFQFLLMSSHFGNYIENRAGFEKLYRQFSDNTWEKAIDLVKFMGKRGGHMSFQLSKEENTLHEVHELHELGSMGKALEMQKSLAQEANSLHFNVTRNSVYDSEVASYLENNFVHQHSDVIRMLSGYTNDLKHLITHEADPSLALYLFDEYLQKSI